MNKKTFSLVVSLLFLNIAAFTQADPPPMLELSQQNTLLVDKIVTATKFEQYFTNYCTRKIKAYAKVNSWTADNTNETIKSIDFKDFKSMMYTWYTIYSTAQLQKMLDALILLNSTAQNGTSMILMNEMIQGNLDSYIGDLIKGLYLKKQ